MSDAVQLFRADTRFLLPAPLTTAAIDPALADWAALAERLGFAPADGGPLPLAVATPSGLDALLARDPQAVLAEGPGVASRLRARFPHVRRYLLHPGYERARIVLPLDDPQVLSFALSRLTLQRSPVRRARNQAVGALLRIPQFSARRPQVTIAQPAPGLPYLLAAATAYGVPADARWALTLEGDELSRCIFYVFDAGAGEPRLVVKFSRIRDYALAFDRDERGLSHVAGAAPGVRAHVPVMHGRFDVDGHHASVESAAPGERLDVYLHRGAGNPEGLALIETIAAWIVRLGTSTATGPDRLASERARLADEVVARWDLPPHVAADVLDLAAVPAVVEHRDLGSWNVVGDARRFTVLDWEDATAVGFPLWDLLYFVTDALAAWSRPATDGERDAFAVRLFRGEDERSPLLFRYVRELTSALGIRAEDVGRLALLGWLHHGLSHRRRAVVAGEHGATATGQVPPLERMARLWLADDALGTRWSAWR